MARIGALSAMGLSSCPTRDYILVHKHVVVLSNVGGQELDPIAENGQEHGTIAVYLKIIVKLKYTIVIGTNLRVGQEEDMREGKLTTGVISDNPLLYGK